MNWRQTQKSNNNTNVLIDAYMGVLHVVMLSCCHVVSHLLTIFLWCQKKKKRKKEASEPGMDGTISWDT